jgi:hypothetical protein
MSCEQVQQDVLDMNWSQDDWQKARSIVQHVERCDRCREAMADFDCVRAALKGDADPEAEPAGGWEAFEARLASGQERRGFRGWTVCLAAAAALLVGSALGWGASRYEHPSSMQGTGPMAKGFSSREIAEHTAAFGQVAEVFEGKTAWMLVSNTGSDLGMADKSGKSGREIMLLRLTMTDGQKIISQADLVMVPGQKADPVIPFVNGQKLRYRISGPSAGSRNVAVRVQVEGVEDGSNSVAALSTNLAARDSRAHSLGQLVTPAGRYELNVAVSYSTL